MAGHEVACSACGHARAAAPPWWRSGDTRVGPSPDRLQSSVAPGPWAAPQAVAYAPQPQAGCTCGHQPPAQGGHTGSLASAPQGTDHPGLGLGSTPQSTRTGGPDRAGETLSLTDLSSARWAHLGLLFPFGVIFALSILFNSGGRSAFVRSHAVEALNFLITGVLVVSIAVWWAVLLAATLSSWMVVPGIAAFGYAVFMLVSVIVAGAAASAGRDYRYPFILRLVR